MRIAVYNEKGGSGKTTLAVHLALGLPALLVDLDEQRTATRWLNNRVPPLQAATVLPPAGTDTVIDFAPGRDLARANALGEADLILVPVRPTFNDLATVANTVRLVRATERFAAFVLAMINPRTSEARDVFAALQPYGLPVWGAMSNRVAYSRAGLAGATAGEAGDTVAQVEVQHIVDKVRRHYHGKTQA